MSSIASKDIPLGVAQRSSVAWVNLLLRKTTTQFKFVELGEVDPDPMLFIVTRINWRDIERPTLSQLPKVLSYLETMRGTKGVPDKVYLDSTEGLQMNIPSGTRVSEIPRTSREAVTYLKDLAKDVIGFVMATSKEVEDTFWKIARKRGFSPEIVDKLERQVEGYDSAARVNNMQRFNEIMGRYFSIRFRIHTAEKMLHLEE
ncbi:MAG: hypothetical protein ACTSV2_06975 [Candidatus Thorarchaeota archaeon]